MTSPNLSSDWDQLKRFYRRAWRHQTLTDILLHQARQLYPSLTQLRQLGFLHQAGNYLVLDFPSRDGNYHFTYFLHQSQPDLTYFQLFDLRRNLVFRLPELSPSSDPTSLF